MKSIQVLGVFSSLAVDALGAATGPHRVERQAAQGTATINLASQIGTPQHSAAGFLYGIPDTPNQILDDFYTDMGFNYGRAGGSQLSAPAKGWVYKETEFNGVAISTF